jgi:putative intracellular protease/amidase
VCHGVVGLLGAKVGPDNRWLLQGKRVTGFSDREEELLGLLGKLPSVERQMREAGGQFTCAEPWSEHVERDGRIVTGQNPASSASVARNVVAALEA